MKTNTTRTSKKWIAILLTVSCLLLTICSCSPSESGNNSDPVDESPDPGSGIETETYKIGVCSPNNGVPFFSRLIAGMEDKAAELGGKYVLDIVDANDDTNTQINQVETFIAQEVDFIVMMPTQVEALIPVAQECNAAGIPFITINRTLTAGDIADTGVDMITYVGADDYLGGQRLGELVEEMTGGEGNICFIQGTLGASFSELRQDGCEDYLAEHCPNVKIIDYQCSNQDQNTAMSIVDNWLVRYGPGEIDGIVGTSTWDAHGAADAEHQHGPRRHILDDARRAVARRRRALHRALQAGIDKLQRQNARDHHRQKAVFRLCEIVKQAEQIDIKRRAQMKAHIALLPDGRAHALCGV